MIAILLIVIVILWLIISRVEGPKRATIALMNLIAIGLIGLFILGSFGDSVVVLLASVGLMTAFLS